MNLLATDRPAIAQPAAPAASVPPAAAAPSTQPRRAARRERDVGIGYGSSSGYGCTRRYATLFNQRLFRCA
ncbi:hypothetical protein [Lysobacter sp. A3-1-A15]|uniref:hypothetical protein n=1 Tax=Novilysobacter viscosus TaxID=3098602 RepID=UPI002ED7E39A